MFNPDGPAAPPPAKKKAMKKRLAKAGQMIPPDPRHYNKETTMRLAVSHSPKMENANKQSHAAYEARTQTRTKPFFNPKAKINEDQTMTKQGPGALSNFVNQMANIPYAAQDAIRMDSIEKKLKNSDSKKFKNSNSEKERAAKYRALMRRAGAKE
jgi:hypothetical protein